MLGWSVVLFCLGFLAVLDSQFNYGHIFRSANSFFFMLLALGILIRTKIMRKKAFRERIVRENIELRARIDKLEGSQAQLKKEPTEQISMA